MNRSVPPTALASEPVAVRAEPSFENLAVDLIRAKAAYQANAAVIRTASEVADATLDLLA